MDEGMRRPAWLVIALLVLGLWLWTQQRASTPPPAVGGPVAVAVPGARPEPALPPPAVARTAEAARLPAFLPAEAHAVLDSIAAGGPFEYRQDGGVFHNRERRLPPQPRGYYREYTVDTPGSPDRGARRIVAGGGIPGERPPREYWYSDDHYRSFRRFEVASPEDSP
jgi:guanyl-specific ribonuclease Sa